MSVKSVAKKFILDYYKNMNILDGKQTSLIIKTAVRDKIQKDYIDKNIEPPCLACIIVGDNTASQVYVANKEKACASVGMKSIVKRVPSNATNEEVKQIIKQLNSDKQVSGILLQLPLPSGFNEAELLEEISPNKDVDSLTNLNLGKLFANKNQIAPCTAQGIIDLLKQYNIEIQGKNVVVVGRSLLVGKSVAVLFEQNNATVTLCHSKTQNLKEECKRADILVVAIGKTKFITADMVKENAVVVDVGINRTENGLVGDVDFENVKDKCSYITPVPGGVGPMTIAELLKNTITLHESK